MKLFNQVSLLILASLLMTSCGEETLTSSTQSKTVTANEIVSYEVEIRSNSHLEKPPVDILYIVDNSGSTVASSFQQIRNEIQRTVNNVSDEFDYHIYFAPLNSVPGDNITTYPLILSHPESVPSLGPLNITAVENLNMFSAASGNNVEHGFSRAISLIENNRSNGIFRNEAHTIVVMISNGDDNEALLTYGGNQIFDSNKFNQLKTSFQKFTKKYNDSNYVSNPMNATSLRFISLVAHDNCNGWLKGTNYKKMSNELYDYQALTDNNSGKDSNNLCSGSYASLFNSVNNSIKQVLVGHSYDYWKISSQTASSINENDITLTKVLASGSKINIQPSSTNGFEYLGYRSNQDTVYSPSDVTELQTGLMVKLNGSARVTYPEYIIAKTVTPTEYFGFVPLPRDPDLSTLEIEINGSKISKSNSNGWSYLGWRDSLNIKVPGPSGASVTPALNRSGYFIQLNGSAIYSNGDTVKVFYKPKAL